MKAKQMLLEYPALFNIYLYIHIYRSKKLIRTSRLTEEILHESIEARSEALSTLRELGPPDLVHLIKVAPRNPGKQVCQQ